MISTLRIRITTLDDLTAQGVRRGQGWLCGLTLSLSPQAPLVSASCGMPVKSSLPDYNTAARAPTSLSPYSVQKQDWRGQGVLVSLHKSFFILGETFLSLPFESHWPVLVYAPTLSFRDNWGRDYLVFPASTRKTKGSGTCQFTGNEQCL